MSAGGQKHRFSFTFHEMKSELRREAAMRRNVYPNQVRRAKMSQATADDRIAMLGAQGLLGLLEIIQDLARARRINDSPDGPSLAIVESLCDWATYDKATRSNTLPLDL